MHSVLLTWAAISDSCESLTEIVLRCSTEQPAARRIGVVVKLRDDRQASAG